MLRADVAFVLPQAIKTCHIEQDKFGQTLKASRLFSLETCKLYVKISIQMYLLNPKHMRNTMRLRKA